MEQNLPAGFLADVKALQPTHPLIIFDFETTGLSHSKDHPIQCAGMIVKYFPATADKEAVVDVITFMEYIRTTKPLHPKITELTGITEEILAEKGKDLDTTMESFMIFMGMQKAALPVQAWYIGHNAIKFDRPFFAPHMERTGRKWPAGAKWWDTAGHHKANIMGLIKGPDQSFEDYHMNALNKRVAGLTYKLTGICELEGISTEGAHNAKADMLMTAWVFVRQCLAMKKKREAQTT